MQATKYQRCTRCVMDTTDPRIVFDEAGICSNCTNWFEIWANKIDRRPIEDVIQVIKQRSKGKYDGVVGISGGVDSSMVAYLAYKHGLNVLLVHVDDGWNTEAAKRDVEIIKEKTGYDCEDIIVDKREFYDILIAYLKAGVQGLEAPTDHLIGAALHRIMDRYGINNILSGSNWVSEGILPKAWVYDQNDAKNIKAIHKRFGTIPIKRLKFLGVLRRTWRLTMGGKRILKLLNHIDYDAGRARETLAREWGWVDYGRKHQENIFTKFVEAYIFPLRFNIDKRLAHYSTLICSGQMTRDKALELLKNPAHSEEDFEKDKQTFMDGLGITAQQFEEFMTQPIRSHEEFATHKRDIQLINLARKALRR